MATIDLGRLGFVNKGTYNNGTTYEKNDLVQFTDGGILSTYLYIDSTAQSGQAPSSSGTAGSRWTFFAKGVADAVASAGNNKVLVTNASGNLTPLAIGSASQALKVNSSANGFEFGSAGGLIQTVTSSNAFHTSNSTSWTSTGYEVTITPTSASNKIHVHCNLSHAGTIGNASLFKIMRSINGASYGDVDLPSARGNRIPAHAGTEHHPSNGASFVTLRIVDSTHNTTNAITYRLYKKQESTSSPTVIGNTHNADANASTAQTATINTNMIAEERI